MLSIPLQIEVMCFYTKGIVTIILLYGRVHVRGTCYKPVVFSMDVCLTRKILAERLRAKLSL